MNFRDLRVATKLWLAVFVGVFALLALIGYATTRSSRLQAESDVALVQIDAKARAAARWSGLTESNAARVQATVITNDGAVDAAFKDSIAGTNAEIHRLQKSVEAMPLNAEDRKHLERIASQQKTLLESLTKLRQHKSTGNNEDARAEADGVYSPAVKVHLQSLREFASMQETLAAATRQEFAEARKWTVRIAQIVVVFLVIGLVLGAAALIRSIRAPLVEAVDAARRIAQGDLCVPLESGRGDEFGDLMRELQRTVARLNEMVREIKTTSDTVGTAAQEIVQGHTDLSNRTEEQASSLEETAASMEEMAATVAQNAENAKKANQLAAGASEVAQEGGNAVRRVVHTMTGISESSKKIGDIVGVIDGIAFQTNILALNAAVEAARAGEQGKGFAVVASEVRSLAQKSAGAAKEIKGLITESVAKVHSGSLEVVEAGKTMEEIVEAVKRVSALIAEISAASQEQSQNLSQVSDTVQQLEKVTQQNAAMTEEAMAASGSLEEQASTLMRAVGGFKLAEEGQVAAPTAARLAPARVAAPALQASKVVALPKRAEIETFETLKLKAPRKRAAGGKSKAEEGWEEY